MSLIDEVRAAINLHGKNGSDTFEYIGLTVQDNAPVSYKLYRKGTPVSVNEIKGRMPYKKVFDEYLSEFLSLDGVSLCDFSESSLNHVPTYRAIFKVSRDKGVKQAELFVDSFFRKISLEPVRKRILDEINCFSEGLGGRSPFMQIGIETDVDGSILGTKYYLSLQQSGDGRIDINKRLFAELGKKCGFDSRASEKVTDYLTSLHYNPIFVGVNAGEWGFDYKLYFISTVFGFQTDCILPESKELLSRLGLESAISQEELVLLYEMGLFIEGLAFTMNRNNEWRLYLNSLPRTRV